MGSAQSELTYCADKPYTIGSIVEVEVQNSTKLGVVLSEVCEPLFACKSIKNKSNSFFSSHQLELAYFISAYYGGFVAEALAFMSPFVEDFTPPVISTCRGVSLSPAQTKAKDFLNSHNASLLFGDTGSGKTEVYISLIHDTLKKNKTVIFLMPEIGLTPQTIARLKNYFGDGVCVWHSKLTKKQKEQNLQAINEGKVTIVAGARSALFLSLSNLGLIIVDEEHDDSYKSNSRPRYNARDLALVYAKQLGIKVVLGSATPSINSYHKVPFFRLKGTFFDSTKNFLFDVQNEGLSELIVTKIQNVLEQKKQVIIFVPTRANFKYLTCRDCNTRFECPFCSVALSLHSDKNALKCHYCGFTKMKPKVCEVCKSEVIEASRIGTSEVLEKLTELFADKRCAKFDKDEIKTTKQLNAILNDFNKNKIDILVGTQMLSKGHDYHDVALCVVLGLDSILCMDEFRARERAVSLAVQISGRSGRKGEGEVLIQTKNAEFFAKYLSDYELFLKDELEFRRGIFPPFVRLVRFLVSHKDERVCQKVLDELLTRLQGVEVVGYGPNPISKIANKYRYHALIRGEDVKKLLHVTKLCNIKFVEVDVDPLLFS